MGDNGAITNNLTGVTACNGYYWDGANISAKDLANNLVWNGNITGTIKSNWGYGITLNEDVIKEIVEKLMNLKATAKITPDEGPEIPKWRGFLPI